MQVCLSSLHSLVLYILTPLGLQRNTGNSDAYKMDLGSNCQELCYSIEANLQKQYACL